MTNAVITPETLDSVSSFMQKVQTADCLPPSKLVCRWLPTGKSYPAMEARWVREWE